MVGCTETKAGASSTPVLSCLLVRPDMPLCGDLWVARIIGEEFCSGESGV